MEFTDLTIMKYRGGSDILQQFVNTGVHTHTGYAVFQRGTIQVCLFQASDKRELIICQYEKLGFGESWRTGKLAAEYLRDHFSGKNIDSYCDLQIYCNYSPSDHTSEILLDMKKKYPQMDMSIRFATLYNILRTSCAVSCYCKGRIKWKYNKRTLENLKGLSRSGVHLYTFDPASWSRLRDLLAEWDTYTGRITTTLEELQNFGYREKEDKNMIEDCGHHRITVNTTTPREILARGPEAVAAYNRAIQEGKKPVYRTRLMLVGQERVGKTSLKKTLTGNKFDPEEEMTDGVETSLVIECAQVGETSWSLQEKENDKAIKEDYKSRVSDHVAKELQHVIKRKSDRCSEDQITNVQDMEMVSDDCRQTDSKMSKSDTANYSDDDMDTDPGSNMEMVSDDCRQTDSEMSKSDTAYYSDDDMDTYPGSNVTSSRSGQSDETMKDILDRAERKVFFPTDTSEPEPITFDIWDFAGHNLYYTTHQVFLSWRAVYLLVFDLSKDLDEKVAAPNCMPFKEVHGGEKSDLTRLEFINFWLASILAHATAPNGNSERGSPPIFLVGTHRESIQGDKDTIVQEVFERILSSLKRKPYRGQVIPQYYAIDNMLGPGDKKLQDLKKHIDEIMHEQLYMGEEIPLQWLKFEEKIIEHGREDPTKNKDQIKDLCNQQGITTDSQTMLKFYHDLGKIVYFGESDETDNPLNDLIVLDPKWLIDVFKKVITIIEPKQLPQRLINAWHSLNSEGILQDQLLEHMWSEHDSSRKSKLVDLMKKFDLVCEIPDPQTEASSIPTKNVLCVPSMFSPRCKIHKQEDFGSLKSITFYADIDGGFTVHMFHRLMSRMSVAHELDGVKLFYRQIFWYCDEFHSALIEMLPQPSGLIKVVVYRLRLGNARRQPDQDDPNPRTVQEVLSQVRSTVQKLWNDWTQHDERTSSKIKMLTKCSDEGCNEMIQLDNCRKKYIRCGHTHLTDMDDLMTRLGFPGRQGTGERGKGSQEPRVAANTGPFRYDIYLIYENESSAAVQKVRDIIKRNGWSVMTEGDSELGLPTSQAIESGMRESRHVFIVFTDEYVTNMNAITILKNEMALQSADEKRRTIAIVACNDDMLPTSFTKMVRAHITDNNLEERLQRTMASSDNAMEEGENGSPNSGQYRF